MRSNVEEVKLSLLSIMNTTRRHTADFEAAIKYLREIQDKINKEIGVGGKSGDFERLKGLKVFVDRLI